MLTVGGRQRWLEWEFHFWWQVADLRRQTLWKCSATIQKQPVRASWVMPSVQNGVLWEEELFINIYKERIWWVSLWAVDMSSHPVSVLSQKKVELQKSYFYPTFKHTRVHIFAEYACVDLRSKSTEALLPRIAMNALDLKVSLQMRIVYIFKYTK